MTKDEMMPKYEAGERKCPICGDPLPAHQTWPGAKYRFCMKPECVAEVKALKWGRYIEHGGHKCEGGDCDNFVPEGRYRSKPNYLTCSPECWHRRSVKGNLVLPCGCGCGGEVLRPCKRKTATGLVFVSMKHQGEYLINKYLTECCGPFREIVDEYLGGYAKSHYRALNTVRKGLGPFFQFLNELGITSLDEVTPKTITQYLAWARKSGRHTAPHDITYVSAFFGRMYAEGSRKAANPVVRLIHYERKKHRIPRPYKKDELDFIWRLLRERGNPRLRLAAAIAEEAGLRGGEICRVRIEDVDMVQQRIFIGLPNKTSRERFAFFSHKTREYYDAWIQARDPKCGHDYLFHNTLGHPLRPPTLADEFKRVLCTTFEGKKIHDTGLDIWSTHRLRHTMATNLVSGGADAATVMAAGGWVTADSMAGYAAVDPALARRGYNEAMRRAHEQKEAGPRTRTLTPAEFLKRRQICDELERVITAEQRCV